jgi:pantoate kinase
MIDEEVIQNRIKSLIDSTNSNLMIGSGYAPAHITGIFEIHNTNPNPLKCGSRGIGFCIDKGVSTIVLAKKNDKQIIKVQLNGEEVLGSTSKTALRNIMGTQKVNVEVHSFTALPLSQGFGLSGAGALSTVLAINSALDLDLKYFELVNAAHQAEISNHSGLGDVVAQATGGVVLRSREGGFKFGKVVQLDIAQQNFGIFIWILGKELKTPKIISNKKYIHMINSGAKKYLDTLKKARANRKITFEDIVTLSFKFASELKIMDSSVKNAITKIHDKGAGCASMVMLGNAIFAIGDKTKLETICKNYGQPIISKLDLARANKI